MYTPSWPNRTLNHFKKAINDACKLLSTGQPTEFEMCFENQTTRNPVMLAVAIAFYQDTPPYELYSSELVYFKQSQFRILTEALVRNSSITELRFSPRLKPLEEALIDPTIRDDVHTCMSLLYRGLERMQNIRFVELIFRGYDEDTSFPTFNLQNARFKPTLERLDLEGYCHSVTTAMVNEITGVMADMTSLNDIQIDCRSYTRNELLIGVGLLYFRIIETSFRKRTLNTLELKCEGLSVIQCAWIAQLLVESAPSLHTLILDDPRIGILGVGTIMRALKQNSILRNLLIQSPGLRSQYSSIEKCIENMLCECTAIDDIISSNHFIEVVIVHRQEYRSGQKRHAAWRVEFRSQTTESIDNDLAYDVLDYRCQKIRDCLRLNSIANKHQVIRTKIFKYFFVNDFDLSDIKSMDLHLLPYILHSILEEQPNSLSALFRILTETDNWITRK